MKNKRIRDAATAAGVKLWEIAAEFGITDSNFSRKLRRELSVSETKKALEIIKRIAAERDDS